jgi:hypothetical protein
MVPGGSSSSWIWISSLAAVREASVLAMICSQGTAAAAAAAAAAAIE